MKVVPKDMHLIRILKASFFVDTEATPEQQEQILRDLISHCENHPYSEKVKVIL